mgnify:CR=1 FL=1
MDEGDACNAVVNIMFELNLTITAKIPETIRACLNHNSREIP